MKYIIRILICILIFNNTVNAQVPGYQGKKFMAGYAMNIIPNYLKIIGEGKQYKTSYIDLRHSFNVEYIVARKLVLGADLEFPSVDYNYYTLDFTDKEDYYSNNNNNNDNELKTTKIKGVSYGFHLTSYGVFSNNPVAPVGDYLRFKLFTLNYTTGLPDADEYLKAEAKPATKSFSTFGVGIGYGQTRVFYNRAVLDVGFESAWITKNSGFTPNDKTNGLSFPENESLRVLFWDYFLTFKIGVSGLFF